MKKDLYSDRSHKYQSALLEIPYSNHILSLFSAEQGLTGYIAQYQHTEEVAELYDQVREEFWKLVDTQLTAHQARIVHLVADGYTQVEISKALGVNQSCINKALNGNLVYQDGKRRFQNHQGGAYKRLKAAVKGSAKIQDLLAQIRDLQEEGY